MKLNLPKRALSLAVVGASVLGVCAIGTGSASAASWKCKPYTDNMDDEAYDGPAPDNFNITVTNCIKEAGSYVYAKATVSFDFLPNYGPPMSNTFDSAHFRLNVNRPRSGTDSVYLKKDYNLLDDFDRMNSSGNGSTSTRTFKVYVGSKKAYTDGTLRFNWQNDGKGVKSYGFPKSPTV
ncbi:hypothetical protein G6045_40080 [Streptomyces sp. YC504]|uniref:Uncharacterized protein n=1 Tax=Streptomyces mesophilus TaxID=1775132 RepID=A0A6G4XYX7_9ACTN|nr:hypothetical protein [Streptomyces mesophilus]NGO81801.1 hypothetical protein [Streptomyces mesophilus]